MRKKFSFMFLAFLGISCISVSAKTYDVKLQSLVEMKYVEGYEDGSFRLDKPITRAEFTKLVVALRSKTDEALVLKNEKSKFSDVGLNHWANGYINLAAKNGYVKGYDDGTFKPQDNLTKEEAIAIITRLYPNFVEKKTDANWSMQYINFARENGILDGLDYDLSGIIDRKSAFEIIYNYNKNTKEKDEVKTEEIKADRFYNVHSKSARGNKNTYDIRVRFYDSGMKVTTKYFEDGDYLKLPKVPTKEGFEFIGWYSGKDKYDENDRLYKDLDLYAKFKKIENEKEPENPVEQEDSNNSADQDVPETPIEQEEPKESTEEEKPNETDKPNKPSGEDTENTENPEEIEKPKDPDESTEDVGEGENSDKVDETKASLKSIEIDGVMLPEFSMDKTFYTVEYEKVPSSLPKITFEAFDNNAKVEYKAPKNFPRDDMGFIKVTSEDGTEKEYTILFKFKDRKSRNFNLKKVKIGDKIFYGDWLYLNTAIVVEFEAGTTEFPPIEAEVEHPLTSVYITNPSKFEDGIIGKIITKAEDIEYSRVYSVRYIIKPE